MRLVLAAALLASVATPAFAAAPIHQYADLALAPRGDRVASIESVGDAHGVITVRSTKDGKVVRTIDPCPACSYTDLAFAPNGTLAWLARDKKAGTVTLAVEGGATPHTVATIAGIAGHPRFSPDGRRIALLVTPGAQKETGAAQAGVRQVGEIGEKSDEQRIALFEVAGPAVAATAVTPLSPANRYIYEYDWMPDGSGFVVTSAIGNGDNNWWVATLDRVDASTGAVTNIANPTTQINYPRVSPDGRTVSYIGGLMSDFGSVGGDVWSVPVSGGTPRDLTAGTDYTVTSLVSTPAGLRGTALRGADLGLLTVGGSRADAIGWKRPASFSAGDAKVAYSADGRTVAMVVQDFTHAPAIYTGPAAAPVQITHDNDAAPAIATVRSVTWKNDGFTVQGWLLAPAGADPQKKAPMVTIVHGGPAAANVPYYQTADGGPGNLLSAGYYVFLPNPRGSYGQGEAFTAANKRDFGGGDLRDILTGIDAVEKVAPVDDARLGLTGGSYGGFMSMWANTQTNRFKAIVAGAGLSNWVSYYGTNGIDQWMLPFFGKTLYQDYKAYEDASAIYFIKNAHTPTFIWAGERDIEVPPTQSTEYWHALKDLNVPTSLVIYPDEGHGVRLPAHVTDLRKRTVAWFDHYLK
ncbi:S9 family peptidase [Sphingomonas sp. GC_Shp_3]|uniref:S9 family peptidase n=1 Tax=Sphingomonas sp. GC_Shp_3 TaxID=2937383 RepID=UPI00226A625B|nr:S9 family peptidase [Sphingomonas sp. GC_Shp_3]